MEVIKISHEDVRVILKNGSDVTITAEGDVTFLQVNPADDEEKENTELFELVSNGVIVV